MLDQVYSQLSETFWNDLVGKTLYFESFRNITKRIFENFINVTSTGIKIFDYFSLLIGIRTHTTASVAPQEGRTKLILFQS